MLLIIIFAALTLIATLLYFVLPIKNFMLSATLTLALVSLCMLGSLVGLDKRHEYFIHKYENQKALISKGAVTYLAYDDCKWMNNKIARHKTFCDNDWIGIWFSEDIGNLEPFVLKN